MSVSLQFKGVSKQYSRADLPAVSDVYLHLDAGETLALIGESGGGKSTLLRLASGLEVPDKGEVLLGDQIVASESVWTPPERRKVGLVFQDGALFPHLDVAQNLAYGLKSLDEAAQKETIATYLERVGLSGKEKRYPHELSGGERQRLSVARALAPQPGIVLMDEPFGSLDPALRRSLRDEIHSLLRSSDATVVLVTHDPEDALTVADKVAILRKGRIEQFGTPGAIYNTPKNEYCAYLFGPANEVAQPDGSKTWIRPENFKVSTTRSERSLAAEVLQIRNVWKHLEVELKPDSENGDTTWLAYCNPNTPCNIGDTVWLTIDR